MTLGSDASHLKRLLLEGFPELSIVVWPITIDSEA